MATQTTNYNLTKPAWDEKVDVSVLNTNSDIIDAQMKQNQTSATQAVANMAPTYDATATYETGDFVTYDNKLWVALEDIATPEAFDNTKWAETTASENFGSGGGGNANERELTLAEYNALSEAEKMNGTDYFVKDAVPESKEIQPDIYSDEEREIGVWTDGKPLYRICIPLTHNYVLRNGSWTTITETATIAPYIETMINFQALSYEGIYNNNPIYAIRVVISSLTESGTRQVTVNPCRNGDDYLNSGGFVILTYTKLADTIGSGIWVPSGVPAVHYSEDEQVVGTWIDGSTLYQKTIAKIFSTTTRESSSVYTGTLIFTMDEIPSYNIAFLDIAMSYYIVNNNNRGFIAGWMEDNAQHQVYLQTLYQRTNVTGYFTIRYTKSTT